MAVKRFGTLSDGTVIEEITIGAGDLGVSVITYGAVIRDVRLAGVAHPLVLGFTTLDDYLHHSRHFGAVAGRCANRIGGGRLTIDSHAYQLSLNEKGRTHLHGGAHGFGKRAWRLVAHDAASVTLALTAADGEEGYPGNVTATVTYAVEAPGAIRMVAGAVTDAPTVVNLAQHSYFNLDGSPDILGHEVQIFADSYTPTDADSIPTGEIRSVAGTDFDLRTAQPIGRMRDGRRFTYDINYAVAAAKAAAPRRQARLASPKSGVSLEVASTEPGVQFYDGAWLGDVPVPGLDGRRYGPAGGCCFEAQYFPDAVNHPNFASPVLRPGEQYRQTTLFSFARA
jgi:aldose 1-epimerase